MRFRSVHTQLRNRLAYMATSEHSPSDHPSRIDPGKQASLTLSISCLKQSRGPAQGQTACGTPRKDLALTAHLCVGRVSHFKGPYESVQRLSAKHIECGVMLRSSPVLFFEAVGALSLSPQ
jgi:hypothetical protein